MSESKSVKGFLSFLGGRGSLPKLLLLLILGVAALFVGALMDGASSKDTEASDTELEEYREREEARAAKMLSEIRGVGECRVHITYSAGERLEMHGGTVTSREPPRVLAVAVICDGGDIDSVRGAVISLLATLYDIGANKVTVQKLG